MRHIFLVHNIFKMEEYRLTSFLLNYCQIFFHAVLNCILCFLSSCRFIQNSMETLILTSLHIGPYVKLLLRCIFYISSNLDLIDTMYTRI
jgi:hypothetical protein